MFSFVWWVIGFYWVTAGGENLTHDSPQLYWFVFRSFPFKVVFSKGVHFHLVLLLTCSSVLQALYYISSFRCGLRHYMCCRCVSHWYCCVLLPAMHNCNLICCNGSGRWHCIIFSILKESFYQVCNLQL